MAIPIIARAAAQIALAAPGSVSGSPAIPVTIREFKGMAELERSLKELRERFGTKTGGIIIRGLRKGAKLIRDEARRRVPDVPSGYTPRQLTRGKRGKQIMASPAARKALLRTNIIEHAIPTGSRLAGGRPTVLVRVRNAGYTRTSTGAIRFNRPGTTPGWWWWLEFGTTKHPATPFLRPAFEAQKVAAVEAAMASIREEIEAVWAKNLPSYKRAA